MNPELDAALDVFENLLGELEYNNKVTIQDKEYYTQLWRKRMEQQIALVNFELDHK
jgi:hypothetical protein